MRPDLTVLCDQHQRPMKLSVVFIENTPSGQNWNEVYVCGDCGRQYHPQFGYFQLEGFRIKEAGQSRHDCPRHAGQALYLRSRTGQGQDWVCLEEGCAGGAGAINSPVALP